MVHYNIFKNYRKFNLIYLFLMNLNTKYYLNLNHGYIQTFYKPKSEPFIKFPGIYLYNFKIK